MKIDKEFFKQNKKYFVLESTVDLCKFQGSPDQIREMVEMYESCYGPDIFVNLYMTYDYAEYEIHRYMTIEERKALDKAEKEKADKLKGKQLERKKKQLSKLKEEIKEIENAK